MALGIINGEYVETEDMETEVNEETATPTLTERVEALEDALLEVIING